MRRRRPLNSKTPGATPSTMSRELDWLVDQWRDASPETRQQLVLEKIRREEKLKTKPAEA